MNLNITRLGHDSPPATDQLQQLFGLYAELNPADPLPDVQAAQTSWKEISTSTHQYCFGGWLGSELVSSCTLVMVPNLTRNLRPYALIENVITRADQRRQGFGTHLLEHAIHTADTLGCYKIMLMTGRSDPGTLAFYEQAGFDPHRKHAFVRYR